MNEYGGYDPAGLGLPQGGQHQTRQSEQGYQPEPDSGKQHAVFLHGNDDSQVVVAERVPEVSQLGEQEAYERLRVCADVVVRPLRPVRGHLVVAQRPADLIFGKGNRVFEESLLVRAHARRYPRVTGSLRIVADVEVDSAVGRKQHGLMSHEVVVQPAG